MLPGIFWKILIIKKKHFLNSLNCQGLTVLTLKNCTQQTVTRPLNGKMMHALWKSDCLHAIDDSSSDSFKNENQHDIITHVFPSRWMRSLWQILGKKLFFLYFIQFFFSSLFRILRLGVPGAMMGGYFGHWRKESFSVFPNSQICKNFLNNQWKMYIFWNILQKFCDFLNRV